MLFDCFEKTRLTFLINRDLLARVFPALDVYKKKLLPVLIGSLVFLMSFVISKILLLIIIIIINFINVS